MVVTSIFYDDDVVDAISDEVEFLLQFVHSVVRQCCSCRGVYSVLVKIGIHNFAIGAYAKFWALKICHRQSQTIGYG